MFMILINQFSIIIHRLKCWTKFQIPRKTASAFAFNCFAVLIYSYCQCSIATFGTFIRAFKYCLCSSPTTLVKPSWYTAFMSFSRRQSCHIAPGTYILKILFEYHVENGLGIWLFISFGAVQNRSSKCVDNS